MIPSRPYSHDNRTLITIFATRQGKIDFLDGKYLDAVLYIKQATKMVFSPLNARKNLRG